MNTYEDMNILPDMTNFISSSPFKTSQMKVTVFNDKGDVLSSYDTPMGFQLERYVGALFPTSSISIIHPVNKTDPMKHDFEVSVLDDNDNIIQVHVGEYECDNNSLYL